jgi:hypothetical protein
MINSRTESRNVRMPVGLLDQASKAKPGLSRSGLVRFALARLAGLPNAEEYAADMPRGRKGRHAA